MTISIRCSAGMAWTGLWASVVNTGRIISKDPASPTITARLLIMTSFRIICLLFVYVDLFIPASVDRSTPTLVFGKQRARGFTGGVSKKIVAKNKETPGLMP